MSYALLAAYIVKMYMDLKNSVEDMDLETVDVIVAAIATHQVVLITIGVVNECALSLWMGQYCQRPRLDQVQEGGHAHQFGQFVAGPLHHLQPPDASLNFSPFAVFNSLWTNCQRKRATLS